MGVQQKERDKFVSCTYRITELHYSFGCATVTAVLVCLLYQENLWVKQH